MAEKDTEKAAEKAATPTAEEKEAQAHAEEQAALLEEFRQKEQAARLGKAP
jgi:hypothetical protein